MAGRKPDYRVGAMDRGSELRGVVGAAWNGEHGRIKIVLDPFVTLTQSGDGLVIMLFPNDGTAPKKHREEPEDEEIPF